MQSDNKFFDDMAKIASGAMGTMLDAKKEIDALIKQNIERFGGANFVSREEFEVVKAMISKARLEQEKLDKRLSAIEKKVGIKKISTKKTTKAAAKKKAATPKKPAKKKAK